MFLLNPAEINQPQNLNMTGEVKECKKAVPFEVKQLQEDDNFFTFEGYASVFNNVDLGDDIIERGAFSKSLKRSPEVPVLWQHDMREPIGRSVMMREDDRGLFVKAILPKEDTLVSGRVMPQMKVGSIKEMSIGFMIKEQSFDQSSQIRRIKEIDLFEFSLVTKAMNSEALVTSFKSVQPKKDLPLAPRDTDWDPVAAMKRVRELSNSKDAPSGSYKDYFMHSDADNADQFSAYKLPFVDVIEGEPHIVPKALFAIAGVLEDEKGGVGIPQDDKMQVIKVVNACYERTAKEFNDDSIVSPLKEKRKAQEVESIRDIEHLLRDCGLSSKEAKTVISRVKELSPRDEGQAKQREAVIGQKEDLGALLESINNFTKSIKYKNV